MAIAELAQVEDLDGVTQQAKYVANNMTIVHRAVTSLAERRTLEVDDIVELHAALLSDEPRHHGLRTVQNWIGGPSHYHPLDADFVPPDPNSVAALMTDLVSDLNGARHSAIVQAALVHAQFETIHPFTDGNGRVGRALIHTVLTRRGLARASLLPISMILATFRDDDVGGLTSFGAGVHDDHAAHEGRLSWIELFTEHVLLAAEEASRLRDHLAE